LAGLDSWLRGKAALDGTTANQLEGEVQGLHANIEWASSDAAGDAHNWRS
jgi:hypothetical protein